VTLSPSSKAEIVRRLRIKPERVKVVPPGIDERFTPGPADHKHARPLVVAVGRLVPVKRFDLLVQACAIARERTPDLELVIVGEGYERPRLDDLVTGLDADRWVTFAGQLRDHELVDLYQKAWVVASASSHEGWGMTLTEAAACGTPVVATRIAGHADSVLDGVTGVLVDARADAFGAALADLLTDDRARRRLANGAQARAGELTWEATATGLMAALVADARSRRRR
jgi:glycosyltransferase involved in cell wall biosynthesis